MSATRPAAEPLVGIDGCPTGWVAARLAHGRITWSTAEVDGIAVLIEGTTAIDIPVGLLEHGWRDCDLAARELLGQARSRVFLTPPRQVLERHLAGAPNDEVQAVCRDLTGQGVSRQGLGLAARILAVDRIVATSPAPDVHEVFPELAFAALAGDVLASKKTAAGVGQRLAALTQWRADTIDVLVHAPSGIPVDDCLDALICLWSAERIARGEVQAVPEGATSAPRICF